MFPSNLPTGIQNELTECAEVGAHFITEPGYDCDITEFAAKKEVVAIPGRSGADFVKVFPCAQVAGDAFAGR